MFTLDDDIMRQLRATFKVEAAEHLQALNRALLAIEDNPDADERAALLEEIFREAHSLKGAAGAADVREVEALAHQLENVFGAARAGKLHLTRDRCDVLYRGIDAVGVITEAALADQPHAIDLPDLYAQLAAVEKGQPAPLRAETLPTMAEGLSAALPEQNADGPTEAPEATHTQAETVPATVEQPQPDVKSKTPKADDRKTRPATVGPAIEETIRVATGKIDALMTQAGELLVAGLKIDQHLKEVEQVSQTLEDWNREWLQVRASHTQLLRETNHEQLRPLVRFLQLNQDTLRSLSGQLAELRRGLSRDALHLSRVTNDLSESVLKVRMLPVAAVFDTFPRLVRDLARESQKEIELKLEGADTELDRKVLEGIKDPLVHLLRNAVDHGLEPPDVREKTGKPRQGTITVRAFQKGNNIVIEVADDGAGIQRNKVRQAAVRAGVIGADEVGALSEDEALRLIFTPGLSTHPIITETSGRGVGMDVVRKNVEALHGQVDIDSTPGRGATIALTLPLTLATTQQLLVQVGDQTFGIPISAVERIEQIDPKDIGAVAGRPAIAIDDEPISLVRLADVLEQSKGKPAVEVGEAAHTPVVILSAFKRRVAFLVDAVVGQQETVVKGLGKQLARVRNVAGATILGSGQVVMTLNPADLMKSVRVIEGRSAAGQSANGKDGQQAQRPTILVVDDSLSTRTLEKNILETAGYKVVIATDGLEALNLLNSNGGCDLIVSDVMMPRLNGFELTAAVRKHPSLKKTPVVLVTSLDSPADKERGIEVGADAYLVKSNFDQANLLQTIAQLI
ncbi:MAG TPA: hybrid sensor histidine kinase/response regulator [Anaerolineae bacterium]|nr:hybrid sensor histidine kinase/response regulator [Anaerolineae bacterium]